MKQLILAFSVIVAFLCGQTVAGATAVAVSLQESFVKQPEKASVKSLLSDKLKPAGKDKQHPLFPKKKRSKGLQHEFLICPISEVQFSVQELPVHAPSYLPNNSFSVQFLPNGKRGPPSLA